MLTRGLLGLALLATPVAAIELELPLACTPGRDCTVQQYPDHDAGPGSRDYACGAETYDGHDGTDIRVLTTADAARGVAVLAAAAGVVKGMRDGVADRLVKGPEDRALIAGRECGNGVVIDHGGGFETQYCHMRRGSVSARKGQRVAGGEKLGEVGYSGDAGFPHLHLTVRRDGKPVDPFAPEGGAACPSGGAPLWSAGAAKALAYRPGEILKAGFSGRTVSLPDVEAGLDGDPPPAAGATALVAYGWLINLKGGDVLTLAVRDTAGQLFAENSVTLERNKAQYLILAGRKQAVTGTYSAKLTVTRAGVEVIAGAAEITID